MKKLVLITLILGLLAVGCDRNSPLFPLVNDADGYYEGWVNIYRPGMGFDRSFHASLRIWDDGYRARLIDDRGQQYVADYVDYNSWSDELEIYFRVLEERWSYDCGHETYDWEMRLIGKIRRGSFVGEIEADIDPEDYYSEYCHMDYNPPPERLGTFDLQMQNDPWY